MAFTWPCGRHVHHRGNGVQQGWAAGQQVSNQLGQLPAEPKPALYDIVDFLKVDIYRTGVLADVDRSGVTRQCKAMFFKLYRHSIDLELLNFCLRGRLLMDGIFITGERHHKSRCCAMSGQFDRIGRNRQTPKLRLGRYLAILGVMNKNGALAGEYLAGLENEVAGIAQAYQPSTA